MEDIQLHQSNPNRSLKARQSPAVGARVESPGLVFLAIDGQDTRAGTHDLGREDAGEWQIDRVLPRVPGTEQQERLPICQVVYFGSTT
jgi:hypothetical protein